MKSSKIIAIALAAAITVSPFAGIASTSVSASESSATIASKKADMAGDRKVAAPIHHQRLV